MTQTASFQNAGFLTYPAEGEIKDLPISQEELFGAAWLRRLRRDVHDTGLSLIIALDGRHRSGKSLAAATLGYVLDATFYRDFERRIVSDHRQFFDVWDGIAKENIHGAVVVVDEAGASLSSADWYEKWLKSLVKMVQTFGYLNPVVLFCSPSKDFVDSRLRRMTHIYVKVSRPDKTYSVLRPYEVRWSNFKSKPLYQKPVLLIGDQNVQLHRIRLNKPPEFLLERYSKLEQARKPKMIAAYQEESKRMDAAEVKNEVDLNKLVAYVVENYQEFEGQKSKPDNIQIDSNQVQFYFKLPTRTAAYVAASARKKLADERKKKIEGLTGEKDSRPSL